MRCPRFLTAAVVGVVCFAAGLQKDFTPQQRRWWAFQKVVKPAVPQPKDRTWVKNDIDAFILAKLEEKNLKPAPPADTHHAAPPRHLDLTGLLPTPGRGPGLRQRYLARRIRESGRPPAGLAALRRALGAALARPGALRRQRRLQER